MALIRSLVGLTLALLVALTSQHAALAQGQAAATGQMVICTGAGLVTIHLDAEGNPTEPGHFCPDCAKVLATALIPAKADCAPVPRPASAAQLPEPPVLSARMAERPMARGPPLTV